MKEQTKGLLIFAVASGVLGLSSMVTPSPSRGASQGSLRPQGIAVGSPQGSPTGRSCKPMVSGATGIQRGRASQALLVPGNTACVEAQFGGVMRLDFNLCGGREVELSGIFVERNGFANGRQWSSNPPIQYEFIYSDGTKSIPQPIGRGFGDRSVSFAPQPVTGVSVVVPSRRTVAYPIYEQVCSVAFNVN